MHGARTQVLLLPVQLRFYVVLAHTQKKHARREWVWGWWASSLSPFGDQGRPQPWTWWPQHDGASTVVVSSGLCLKKMVPPWELTYAWLKARSPTGIHFLGSSIPNGWHISREDWRIFFSFPASKIYLLYILYKCIKISSFLLQTQQGRSLEASEVNSKNDLNWRIDLLKNMVLKTNLFQDV